MSPDDVLREYSESKVKIKVAEVDESILIEGTGEALVFLSKLLSAQAEADDDGFNIFQFDAWSSWFSAGSTKGIYVRRISG